MLRTVSRIAPLLTHAFLPATTCIAAQLEVPEGRRHYASKQASNVRNNDLLQVNQSIVRVANYQWSHGKARASGSISCELVDIRTGAKSRKSMANDEQVEVAELQARSFQVLFTDDSKKSTVIHVMDPETFEQIAVPGEIFGSSSSRWLLPDMMVELKSLKGQEQPVTGSVPLKLQVKVAEARPAIPRTDGTTNRHVVVQGGVSIMVPGHIQENDLIWVNTVTNEYVGKEKT